MIFDFRFSIFDFTATAQAKRDDAGQLKIQNPKFFHWAEKKP